ncbi:unnamed protein product [marine sediment metagenome]|uniref:Uncharacterized protein n=1 Tax=marine sediment metagenome TaxID=412755 RepID=X1KG75_9ZZZZ
MPQLAPTASARPLTDARLRTGKASMMAFMSSSEFFLDFSDFSAMRDLLEFQYYKGDI